MLKKYFEFCCILIFCLVLKWESSFPRITEKLNETVDDLKQLLRSTFQHYPVSSKNNVLTSVVCIRSWAYKHTLQVTVEAVKKLKAQGYELGICSNHSIEWFRSLAEQFKIYDLFERVHFLFSSQWPSIFKLMSNFCLLVL
jgi:FMN phosphatase YigB (HAD superfamily)